MSFWRTSGLQYQDLNNLDTDKLLLLVNSMNRCDLIDWLSWNDPNGIYRDDQSLKELGNVMSREEGVEILLRQILENKSTH